MSALRDGCGCDVERVQDCSNLDMGSYATTCRAHILLIELRGNGVVAGRTGPHEPSSTWQISFDTPLASQTFDRDVTKLQARPCSTAAIEAAVSPHRL